MSWLKRQCQIIQLEVEFCAGRKLRECETGSCSYGARRTGQQLDVIIIAVDLRISNRAQHQQFEIEYKYGW